jgi:hypothetical protein
MAVNGDAHVATEKMKIPRLIVTMHNKVRSKKFGLTLLAELDPYG